MIRFLKSIGSQWQSLSLIFGIGIAFVVGYKYLEGIKDSAEKSKTEMIEVVKAYADTTSMHLFRVESSIYEMQGQLWDVKEEQVTQGRRQNVMKEMIVKEIAKTPQEVFDLLQVFEVKKNNTGIQSPEGN